MKNFRLSKHLPVFCIVCLFLINSVFAQHPQNPGNESWKMLQKAQAQFDQKNYNKALKLAGDCLSQRKKEVEYLDYVLENSLKPYQVRKVGDDIDEVLKILKERDEYESIEIIKKYLNIHGKEFFKHSIKNFTEYLHKRIDYPEVYFLIAKIYKLEGEFDMALTYLQKARDSSFLLEVPEEITDINYAIADIAEYKNNIELQERTLLLIVGDKGRYGDKDMTLKNALLRTSKSEKEDNSSRFFELYRIDAIQTEDAFNMLTKIYINAKKYKDAYLTNLYSVLICFTHINSILEERESDYHYTDLGEFFNEIKKYPDIYEWCNEHHFWEGFYNIYSLGQKNYFYRFPLDIITVMASDCPEQYWKNAASQVLLKKQDKGEVVLGAD